MDSTEKKKDYHPKWEQVFKYNNAVALSMIKPHSDIKGGASRSSFNALLF